MDAATLEIIKTLTPAFLGLVGLVITFIFSISNRKLNHQKMEKELFSEFNRRYDTFNDSLNLLDSLTTLDELKSTCSLIDNKNMHHLLIDYFNLCAEEYYWYRRKRINKLLWSSWNSGMMYYYNKHPVVRELWQSEVREGGFRSYYLKKGEDFFITKV